MFPSSRNICHRGHRERQADGRSLDEVSSSTFIAGRKAAVPESSNPFGLPSSVPSVSSVANCSRLSVYRHNGFDFDQQLRLHQLIDANHGRGGRILVRDVAAAHIHYRLALLLGQAHDEYRELDDVLERRANTAERKLQVLEHLYRLGADVAFAHHVALRIDR